MRFRAGHTENVEQAYLTYGYGYGYGYGCPNNAQCSGWRTVSALVACGSELSAAELHECWLHD